LISASASATHTPALPLQSFDDKHTNRDDSQLKDIDEDELDAEIVELEADLTQE
jgi:hypothetical protein